MDFNATIDLIIKDLNEAREIIDDLKRYPGVPAIQVELAKSKCRNAGEIISLLKHLQEDNIPETAEMKPVIPLIKDDKAVRREFIPSSDSVPAASEPEEKSHPFSQTEDQEVILPDKKNNVSMNREKESGSGIIADKFSNLSTSLNEQVGGKKGDDDIGGVLKTKPLADLSDAIGINDRFMFIREIFDGNRDAYNQAISRLNSAANMDDAKAVITGYPGGKSGNEAVKQLLDLVKRKLPHNE
ncbi:MAG TPA: hypothetical protein VJ963_15590 [Bacteroidales bacterium]|nr:hypothetical protein [Bacteroidales bacterium]